MCIPAFPFDFAVREGWLGMAFYLTLTSYRISSYFSVLAD